MATLTGFKSVGESGALQQTNGQENPVFVFDEVDVSDTNRDSTAAAAAAAASANNDSDQTNEIFVDASTDVSVMKEKQPADHSFDRKTTTPPPPPGSEVEGRTAADVAIEMSEPTKVQVQRPPPSNQSSGGESKRAISATGNQIQKGVSGGAQVVASHERQRAAKPNTLAPDNLRPNGADDMADKISVSMLTVDHAGSGKSPRQPRRSPLMSLFRGKPRESVRRLYTDEDQFEIEWANLSLEFHKKWYQKLGNLMTGKKSAAELQPSPQTDAKLGVNGPQSRLILNGVDGRISSGEITAVLGPSGAGKTSLLNGLFGKYRTMVQGSIKVTGAPSKKHLTVCTIPQSDYLIGYLTTEESLWFASRLKNCEFDFNHDRNIERVIELLGLQRCRHTRINKLSGGQYKRVSIAQEMLSSPDILVLDEPTSGLDSLTCYRTVKVLRDLVEASKAHNLVNPMSIILTIHQPHREVLDLFHSVYIMAVGGQTLYQGPPNDMEDWVNKYSGVTMPTEGYNPASFMVELASEEYGRKPIEVLVARQREKFRDTTKHQYKFELSKTATNSVDKFSQQPKSINNSSSSRKADSTMALYPLDGADKYVDIDLTLDDKASGRSQNRTQFTLAGDSGQYRDIDSRIMTPRSGKNSDGVFWRHVNLMSKRCFLSNTRDPLLFTMRVGAHIFIPLIVAIIYGPKMGIPNGCPFYKPEINLMEFATVGVEEIQEKHDDIRVQFQNVGLYFMIYYIFGVCTLALTAISFPLIMHVLVKEIRNGWYSLSTFIMGKMIAELPLAIILPPISVGITYIMTGQPSSYLQWRYCVQSVILILIVMIAEAKGLMFGAICMNSMQTAVFAASVSTVPFILLSGFLIRIREVPYALQHFARFSYFKHSVEALIITRYGFGMCPCDQALIPAGGTPRIIGIPPQIMSLTDYYVNAYVTSDTNGSNTTPELETSTETNILGNNRNISRIVSSITSLSPETISTEPTEMPEEREGKGANVGSTPEARSKRATSDNDDTLTIITKATSLAINRSNNANESTDGTADEAGEEEKPIKQGFFFDKLAILLTRANAFGFNIVSCEDVEPYTMKDMQLKDSMLPPLIGYLFLFIVILKFISYFIVEICVKLKL